MRGLFALVVIAAALFLGYWWFGGHSASSAYAPREAQDTELAVQPTPEPTPAPPPPTDFKSDSYASLPNGPIPYDQLDKKSDGAYAGADPNTAPPEKKSNDKAIFY